MKAARVASPFRVPARRRRYANAYCPFCGAEQPNRLLTEIKSPEDCLCPGRCSICWQALALLRTCESGNEALASRRQLQWEAHQTNALSLSELLFDRWRAKDWTVEPEDLLGQLQARPSALAAVLRDQT